MSEELILRSLDIARDAEALATFWNESDDQWPGSFTGGVPMTAERITRWYHEEEALDVMIWATPEGRIAAYCSLQKNATEPGVGYVALLNVHPAFQKRSLARKLLQESLERCIKLGFRRLDLHTWPGNLKSVPLYKKTGFFWMPDTDVYMQNYIPGILDLPAAQPYFAKHNWYETFVRQLEQHEDDERWQGMKVFTYHWEADGDTLTVWVDREGRAITGIDTAKFAAAAIPAQIAPPKGLPTNMRWEVRNKSDRPLTVSLIARGTDQMKLDYQANLTVAPGETVTRTAAMQIAADMPPVPKDGPAPRIETLLLVDGELLALGTGLRPEPAVVVETMPKHFAIAPGAEREIHVQLRNALDQPVTATVDLVAPQGLTLSAHRKQVSLPAHGQSGLPVTVRAEATGVYPIAATVSFQTGDKAGEAAPQTLPVFALLPGQALAHADEQQVRVMTTEISYVIRRKGGRLEFMQPETDQMLGAIFAEYGLPYEPWEFEHEQADVSWRPAAQGVVVETRQVSKRFPGLTLVREAHFSGGPLVQVVYRTANVGDRAHQPELLQFLRRRWEQTYDMVLPLRSGLLSGSTRVFPRGDQEVPRASEDYAEKWAALVGEDTVLGVIWNRAFDELRAEWSLALHRAPFAAQPHAWAEPFACWLYVGHGGWQDVQRAYYHLSGRAPETARREPAPLVALSFDPAMPATQSRTLTTTLRLENRRQQVLKGDIRLKPPAGWRMEPTTLTAGGVDREHPFTANITLHQDDNEPGAYIAEALLSTPLNDTVHPLPFVRLGNGAPVEVREEERAGQRVMAMDNGQTQFVVAPEFAGAMVAWITPDGMNHLDTRFPVVATKSWMAPWYGGIWPMLMAWEERNIPGKLYQESFKASPITARDGQHIIWQGVRLTCDPQREPLRGLQLQLDYLTVGGSPLLKLVYRLVNRTEAVRRMRGEWLAYWAPDGTSENSVLHGEGWESKRTNFVDAWIHVKHWGAITNPETGRTAIAVAPEPVITLTDEGKDSNWILVGDRLTVPAGGTVERITYLALAPDLASARRYMHMKEYK